MSSSRRVVKHSLKHRHSSLTAVEQKNQVRKRLEAYRKLAKEKFERERDKMTKLSRRTRSSNLKVKKRQTSNHKGASLFRSAVGGDFDMDASMNEAMRKRLVTRSVFHKGGVTQVKTKGLQKVGKLDPKLVSRFHKLKPGEKARRRRRHKKNKKKSYESAQRASSFFGRTSQSLRASSMGRWMSSRLGWRNSSNGQDSARKIARDLRKSDKFKKRKSNDSVYEDDVVVITDTSVLDDSTTRAKEEVEENEENDVDYSKMLTFVTFHQALFRRLKRIVRFNKTRLDVFNEEGERRHRFAYKTCAMKMMTPRHIVIQFTEDEKTRTYGLFAADATHIYFEYQQRRHGIVKETFDSEEQKSQLDNAKPALESKGLKRVATSRRLKIFKMTGLTEMQRVNRFLRDVFYDPDSDEGRTILHFLNTTCPITTLETKEAQPLAEKVNVFMIQLGNFFLKQRFQELRQVLDEDDFEDVEDPKLPDTIRHQIRLRVEEAVYLPIRSRLSPRLLAESASSSPERENEEERDETKRDENTPCEVNLEQFKKFPPEHWGVEHHSPSNWDEPIKHLRRMGLVQLPSEMLQEVLHSARAVFETFRSESKAAGQDASELGADDFLPVHIYALTQAGDVLKDPMRRTKEMLALCHPDTLRSEAGYYLTSMESALEYLLSMR